MNIVDKIGPVLYNKHVWSDPSQRPLAKASVIIFLGNNFSFLFMALFFRFSWQWIEGSNAALLCILLYNTVVIVSRIVKNVRASYEYVLYTSLIMLLTLSFYNGGPYQSSFSLFYIVLLQVSISLGGRILKIYIIALVSWFLFWYILEGSLIHFTNTLPVAYRRTLLIINVVIFLTVFISVQYARLMEVEGNEQHSLKIQSLQFEKELEKTVNQQVLEAISSTEEKERKRVATDLHDSIGPLLSSVKLSMSAMTIASAEDQKKMLDTSLEIINEAISDVRQISHNMMPIPIQEKGLFYAVSQLLQRFEVPDGLHTHINFPDQKTKLNAASSAILYRAIEELVNNTIKHAEADNIYLDFTEKDIFLEIIYRDDGKGFDVEAALAKANGMGLNNVKDRIRTLNGDIKFESSNGFRAEIKVHT